MTLVVVQIERARSKCSMNRKLRVRDVENALLKREVKVDVSVRKEP